MDVDQSHGPAPSQRGRVWNGAVTRVVLLECNQHKRTCIFLCTLYALRWYTNHCTWARSTLVCQVSTVVVCACILWSCCGCKICIFMFPRISGEKNNSSNGAVPDPSSLWRGDATKLTKLVIAHYLTQYVYCMWKSESYLALSKPSITSENCKNYIIT